MNCEKICENKLKIKDRSSRGHKNFEIELMNMKKEEGIYLKELNIYIIKLLNYFWIQPNLTAELLYRSDITDVKNNLAPFFGNFFYENYLSPYYLNDNLLYVYAFLLKKEIMNLKNINDYDSFLNDSCAGILLGELKDKNELGTYFRKIINPTIEKLEFKYWKANLTFEIPKDDVNKDKKKEDNKDEFVEEEIDLNLKSYEDQSILKKYFINLTKEHIIKEKENSNNETLKNLYENYLNIIISDKNLLLDSTLYFQKFEICPELFDTYKITFSITIDCLSQLISDLKSNINSFPHSLKCICKIISLLIEQKFPSINPIEKNAFIGKYIFIIVFIPLFCEPNKKLLLTKNLIFDKTKKNCEFIAKILQKLILGKLFLNQEKNYSPFNLFFIEKIKDIIYIYDNITKVNLPKIIEDLIYDKIDSNYELNIEEINKEEIIYNKFICFQFDDILAIVDTLEKNQEIFFKDNKNIGLRKTFEKLTNETSKEIIRNIKENKINGLSLKSIKENEIQNQNDSKDNKRESLRGSLKDNSTKEKIKHFYFYTSDLFINKQYEEYFKLENKTTITSNLVGASKEDIIKNNIQKVKDCICIILENYQTLSERKFTEENIKDTKSIFREIQKASFLNNYFIDNTIPSKWYLSSFFEYLEKLPEEYANNDYELLFSEIEKEMNNFIKYLDFDFLATFREKLNFSQKNLDNYNYVRKEIKKALMMKKIEKIITIDSIPITFFFNYDSRQLEIKPINLINQVPLLKDIRVMKEKHKTFYAIRTIESFIRVFPNLVKYQIYQDEDTLELVEKLKIPEKINEYIELINLRLEQIFHGNKYVEIAKNRIYDYILSRLYDKIFPQTEDQDDKIYQKTIMLAWVKQKHFISEGSLFNLDIIQGDFHRYINQIQEKKSPIVKFKSLSNIFKLLNDSARFYGYELEGTDDTLNVLFYLLIKEQPVRLYSNCKYMDLFLLDKKGKKEDIELKQFLTLCEKISKISHKDLNNISLEEFNTKCKEATENILK